MNILFNLKTYIFKIVGNQQLLVVIYLHSVKKTHNNNNMTVSGYQQLFGYKHSYIYIYIYCVCVYISIYIYIYIIFYFCYVHQNKINTGL